MNSRRRARAAAWLAAVVFLALGHAEPPRSLDLSGVPVATDAITAAANQPDVVSSTALKESSRRLVDQRRSANLGTIPAPRTELASMAIAIGVASVGHAAVTGVVSRSTRGPPGSV